MLFFFVRRGSCSLTSTSTNVMVRVLLEMDARIHALEQQVRELIVRLDASEQRVKLLEDQLAKNSRNSSKPRWVPDPRPRACGKRARAPRAVSPDMRGKHTRWPRSPIVPSATGLTAFSLHLLSLLIVNPVLCKLCIIEPKIHGKANAMRGSNSPPGIKGSVLPAGTLS